jgi:hypothetical protein
MLGNSRATLIVGLALIGLGVLFLLQQVFDLRIFDWLWPLFIIGFGGLIFAGMVVGGKSAGPLAIPGSIISGIGLILFTLNLTDRWEAWAYAWGLIIAFVGVGLGINGWWSGLPGLQRSGFALMRTGLFLFLIFGAFFELLIFGSAQTGNWLWPVVLIGLGILLLVRRTGWFEGLFAPRPTEMPASQATVEANGRPVTDDQSPAK